MKAIITGESSMAKEAAEHAAALGISECDFFDISGDPDKLNEAALTGIDACLVVAPTCVESLKDTMTCRSFFEEIHEAGITTIMSAVKPEGNEPNWLMYMGMVLPYIDVLYANFNDALWMFENSYYEDKVNSSDPELCDAMSLSILNMGAGVVIFNLGDDGIYLRSNSVRPRLESMGACAPTEIEKWWARELYVPACEEISCSAEAVLGALLDNKYPCPKKVLRYISTNNTDNNKKPLNEQYKSWTENNGVFLSTNDKVEA